MPAGAVMPAWRPVCEAWRGDRVHQAHVLLPRMDTSDLYLTPPDLRAAELRLRSGQLLDRARQLRRRSEQLIGRRELLDKRVRPGKARRRSAIDAASAFHPASSRFFSAGRSRLETCGDS